MLLAFVLAGLTLSGRIEVAHLFVVAAGFGLANAFDIPARQAFVVDMVGREDLVNAIALNSSMFNGARIVGPAVAGGLVAAVGEGWCFLLNAVSYVGVLTGLALMRLDLEQPVPVPGSALARLTDGFRFAGGARPVRALLLLLGLVSLVGMPYAVLMPVFADEILGGGPNALGLLMGASGAGALTGALFLAQRTGIRGLGRWVARAAAGFGLSLIAFSLSRSLLLSMVLLLPVGFFMMTQMASSNTLIQVMVPDALRGRVMAVYSMMFMGMAPVGALTAGLLAEQIGAPLTVALGGGVSVVGAAVFAWRLPTLRTAARELIVAQQMTGGAPSETITGEQSAAAPRPQLTDAQEAEATQAT
jgi:MFS family permease